MISKISTLFVLALSLFCASEADAARRRVVVRAPRAVVVKQRAAVVVAPAAVVVRVRR